MAGAFATRGSIRTFGPNWFASIMGTGIVANAAAGLPVSVPGLRAGARLVWLLAAVLLALVLAATVRHWLRDRQAARSYAFDPVMSHFYGAPPMALLTVGAGAILLGRDLIGLRAAVDLDWVLWSAGTALGLLTAAAVPYLMFTRHENAPDAAFGGWLMPIVPPMVSASTGALLVPHIHSRQGQLTMLYGCYAMFGLALIGSLVTITLIWGRLVQHHVGPAVMVPTLWIVLGPLGQSITAAGLLGAAAPAILTGANATAAAGFATLYGVITFGFAALWFAIVAAVTLRAIRERMPFALTWWSFTFPVGTCVTGASGLAARTGSDMFRGASVALFLFLLLAWATVAARTASGAFSGRLLRAGATERVVDRGLDVKPGRREQRHWTVAGTEQQFQFGAAEDDALRARVDETPDDLAVSGAGLRAHDPAT